MTQPYEQILMSNRTVQRCEECGMTEMWAIKERNKQNKPLMYTRVTAECSAAFPQKISQIKRMCYLIKCSRLALRKAHSHHSFCPLLYDCIQLKIWGQSAFFKLEVLYLTHLVTSYLDWPAQIPHINLMLWDELERQLWAQHQCLIKSLQPGCKIKGNGR